MGQGLLGLIEIFISLVIMNYTRIRISKNFLDKIYDLSRSGDKLNEITHLIIEYIFLDKKIKPKREKYIATLPEQATQMMRFHVTPNITKEELKQKLSGFIESIRIQIQQGVLET